MPSIHLEIKNPDRGRKRYSQSDVAKMIGDLEIKNPDRGRKRYSQSDVAKMIGNLEIKNPDRGRKQEVNKLMAFSIYKFRN